MDVDNGQGRCSRTLEWSDSTLQYNNELRELGPMILYQLMASSNRDAKRLTVSG